jgi:peroxiredoxin
MPIQVGDRVPNITLYVMGEGGPQPVTTDELLSGKRVVLFALPGAFTPTCSASHLPGFVVNADEIYKKQIDHIICLSVNDAFVMDAWGKAQNVDHNILMVADGNADFTEAIGLDEDRHDRGMGIRSQRYSMIIEDGIVKMLNIEAPGKFEVSSAEQILKQL